MKTTALNLLKKAVGKEAEFRPDQWEAIEAVEKTGLKALTINRWTMTICGKELRSNGAGKVYPFALASVTEGA